MSVIQAFCLPPRGLPAGTKWAANGLGATYNIFMASSTSSIVRSAMLALACVCAAGFAQAQQAQEAAPAGATPTPNNNAAPKEGADLEGRRNQKIERIRHEDGGAVIDELRYGGETRSIAVQPKANVPAYEIQPTDMARSRPADHRDGMSSATGQRVWNIFRF